MLVTWPSVLKYTPVCNALVVDRDDKCGSLLHDETVDKYITNGVFDFDKFGCYVRRFSEAKVLLDITHRATMDKITPPIAGVINADTQFVSNFDDMDTRFIVPGLPEVFVHEWFRAASNGPYSSQRFHGKSANKDFKNYAISIEQKWKTAKALLTNTGASAVVSKLVKDAKHEEQSEKMKKARISAKANAKKRFEACVVSPMKNGA